MNKDSIIIKKLEDIGKVKHIIGETLSLEIFDKLHKRDSLWDNEHEVMADLLWDLRSYFLNIQDRLEEVMNVLERDYDDN